MTAISRNSHVAIDASSTLQFAPCAQAGDDDLSAFSHDGKAAAVMRAAIGNQGVEPAQCAVATALHASIAHLGAKDALLVARRFPSFAALTRAALVDGKLSAVAALKGDDAKRCVGPAAAKRLHFFLTCKDPDAEMP